MPHSPADQSLAVTAEVLFLSNLLLLPGIAFTALLYLHWRHAPTASPLARNHLRQTLRATLWAGVLLLLVVVLILLLGDPQGVNTWVILITYFTLCHSTLVMFGAFGLAKAMAGQSWRYPLVGAPLLPESGEPASHG